MYEYLYELLHHLQGAGLLGLYASILFKEAGYKEIFCSDIHHDRLDMAAKFGALPIKLGEAWFINGSWKDISGDL